MMFIVELYLDVDRTFKTKRKIKRKQELQEVQKVSKWDLKEMTSLK